MRLLGTSGALGAYSANSNALRLYAKVTLDMPDWFPNGALNEGDRPEL
jgi:hypothetical protein